MGNVPFIYVSLLAVEISIDYSKDSYDGGDQLNHNGAVKYSRWLGNYLKKNYDLPDGRDKSDYSMYTMRSIGQ